MFHGLEIIIILAVFLPTYLLAHENPRRYLRWLTIFYIALVLITLFIAARTISDTTTLTLFLYTVGLLSTGGILGIIVPLFSLFRSRTIVIDQDKNS